MVKLSHSSHHPGQHWPVWSYQNQPVVVSSHSAVSGGYQGHKGKHSVASTANCVLVHLCPGSVHRAQKRIDRISIFSGYKQIYPKSSCPYLVHDPKVASSVHPLESRLALVFRILRM